MIDIPAPIRRHQHAQARAAHRARTQARAAANIDRAFDRLSLVTVAACLVLAAAPMAARLAVAL